VEWQAGGRVLVCRATKEAAALGALELVDMKPDDHAAAKTAPAAAPRTKPPSHAEDELLSSWEGEVDGRVLRLARRILASTTTRLEKMAAADRQREGAAAIQSCVKELNVLDAKNDNFIQTIEAEDLHAAIGVIAERFGIQGWEEIVDRVRDW
jgi:hypothetical protein